LLLRRHGGDLNQAAGGVAPEQRTLRPLEHRDLLRVE
jgi:hypothetical protein